MIKWFRRLRAVGDLIVAYTVLKSDVDFTLKDPQVKSAWDRFRNDPLVAEVGPRISAEWRAVEEAIKLMR